MTESSQVEEWIDGATIKTKTEEVDTRTGFAWSLYDQLLKFFAVLIPLVPIDCSSTQSKKYKKSLKYSMGKLLLWGDEYRDGRLETVLEKSDDLKETILETLVYIGNTLIYSLFPVCRITSYEHQARHDELLRQFHELEILLEKSKYIFIVDQETDETDQSNECDDNTTEPDGEVLGQLSKVVISLKISAACLMDLLPSMENTLNYADFKNCNTFSSQLLPFEVSGPAQPYVINVLDRFSKADARLVKRLGEANWQRYTALRDVHGAEIQYGDSTEEVAPEIQIMPKSVFIPVSLFHDPGLGSSLPAQSNYAASVASYSSFVSSLAYRNDGSSRVPSTPIEVFEEKPFKCQICGHILSRIKNRVDWKRHLFADLKPYICTSALCSDELLMFPTRKLWETHEFTEHRIDHAWNCSKCSDQFPFVSEWRTHLAEKHSIEFTEIQSHHAERVAERVSSHPRELTSDSEKSSIASDENFTQIRADQLHDKLHLQSMQNQEWPKEQTNYAGNKKSDAEFVAAMQTEVKRLIKIDNTTAAPNLPRLACPFHKMNPSVGPQA